MHEIILNFFFFSTVHCISMYTTKKTSIYTTKTSHHCDSAWNIMFACISKIDDMKWMQPSIFNIVRQKNYMPYFSRFFKCKNKIKSSSNYLKKRLNEKVGFKLKSYNLELIFWFEKNMFDWSIDVQPFPIWVNTVLNDKVALNRSDQHFFLCQKWEWMLCVGVWCAKWTWHFPAFCMIFSRFTFSYTTFLVHHAHNSNIFFF